MFHLIVLFSLFTNFSADAFLRLAQNNLLAPGTIAPTPYIEQAEAKTPPPPPADPRAEIRALKAENSRLRGQLGREILEIETLRTILESSQKENEQRLAEANNQGRRMSEFTERFGDLNREIGEKDATIARLTNEQLAENGRWSKYLAYAVFPFTAILLVIAILLVRISRKQNIDLDGQVLDGIIQAERQRFLSEIEGIRRTHQLELARITGEHAQEIDRLHTQHGKLFDELQAARRQLETGDQSTQQPAIRLVPPPRAEGDSDAGQRTAIPVDVSG
jgi:hypothetical protein